MVEYGYVEQKVSIQGSFVTQVCAIKGKQKKNRESKGRKQREPINFSDK